jgi:hypothetical protein
MQEKTVFLIILMISVHVGNITRPKGSLSNDTAVVSVMDEEIQL